MSYLIVDVIRIVLFRCATHKEGVSAGGGGGGSETLLSYR